MKKFTVYFKNMNSRVYTMELEKLIRFLIENDLIDDCKYIYPDESDVQLIRFKVVRKGADGIEYYFARSLTEMVFEFLIDSDLNTVEAIGYLDRILVLTGSINDNRINSLRVCKN